MQEYIHVRSNGLHDTRLEKLLVQLCRPSFISWQACHCQEHHLESWGPCRGPHMAGGAPGCIRDWLTIIVSLPVARVLKSITTKMTAIQANVVSATFYQPGVLEACERLVPKIALCFPQLSVCLFVRPHLSCAQYYVMHYYATAVYYCTNRFWRFGGQDTASKCRFVLPIRRKSDRQP